ncbi:MAG TPA: right-handed parallel beta-helix repeat-containing protein [Planctomycetota bacterium]|nr:right-handed parallel beta-helix repeat-containing protein [Planctomycetota bacterium]
MHRRALPSACIALLALAAPAAADTLKVPKDFATIGEAVAAAQAGDTISVAKGTYLEQVVVTVSDIALVGKQAVIDAEYGAVCLDIQADDVAVSGFTLVNGTTGLAATGNNIDVSKCTVRSCSAGGLSLEGGAFVVSGNDVADCGGDGIEYTRTLAGQSVFEKNTVTANSANGITLTGDGLSVSKNTCELNGGRGLFVDVVTLPSGAPASPPPFPPVQIQKNTCDDNDVGMLVFGQGEAQITVTKNECSRNGDRGMIVDAVGLSITSNTCDDNGNTGMHLLIGGAQVEKNVSSGNGHNGITVDSNVVADGGGFGDGSDNQLVKNTCKGNGRDGITVLLGANNVLDGNKCIGNGDDGIDLDDTSITEASLTGNTCNDNGHEGLDNSGQATAIDDNVCKANGYGIGPDIAGTGDDGEGTVSSFTGNTFGTGGADSPSRLDDYLATAPK